MAKKFLSLTLLTALVLTTVIVHAEEEENSIPAELINGMKSDNPSSDVSVVNKPVVNKKEDVKNLSLLYRSSDYFTRLEITEQQKNAQVLSREGLARNAVNQIVDLLLENSGNAASQWKAELILRSFSSEERVSIYKAVVRQLENTADTIYDVSSQKRVAGGANAADAIAVGAHVLEIHRIEEMVRAQESFFVNGPSGIDYVYDKICANKFAAVVSVWAIGATTGLLYMLKK